MRCERGREPSSSRGAERPKRRAKLADHQLRLFPRRKMTALGELVEVDEIVVSALGPTFRPLLWSPSCAPAWP